MDNPYSISIIIPVLHEEAVINELLRKLYDRFPNEVFEVIVSDGDPDGSTLQVITFPEVVKTTSKLGRGSQLNTGAKLARGEYLLFLHADTELPPESFRHIREVMADKRYVAGAFRLGLNRSEWYYNMITTTSAWRCRLTRLPYGDQAFFMSKAYFFTIGGFQEIPIMEDLELMQRIKRRGEKVHISMKYSVKTSVRRWEKEGVAYALFRGWVLASLFSLGISPYRLWKFYRTHHQEE